MKQYPFHYVPAKRRHIVADLIGESGYLRIYVARINNPITQKYLTIEGGKIKTDPTEHTQYCIVHQQYSRNDGHIINDGSIYTDENDNPFLSLAGVIRFIQIDAVNFWGRRTQELKVKYLISDGDNMQTNHELFLAEENVEAWELLYHSCVNWLNTNGEPRSLRVNAN
jgi:hypothetical protein